MVRRHLCRTLLVCGLAALAARGEDVRFTALFVFNFAKSVEWPSQEGDFVFGVVGTDPVAEELSIIAGKTKLGAQSIVVKTFENAETAETCNVLYVSPGQSGSLGTLLEKFGGNHVLVVTNKKGLAEAGAPINLAQIDGKQRYEINTKSLKKTGLVAKPVLFKLGTVVSEKE